MVQIDIINLDQNFGSLVSGCSFSTNLNSVSWKKFPSVMESLMHKETSGLITWTSKLNSGFLSFLPRRWVLEIGYL